MTEPRKPQRGGKAKQAKPRGPVLFVTLDPDTEASLRSFLAAQDVPPDRSAVGLKALREFLASRGHYPPKK